MIDHAKKFPIVLNQSSAKAFRNCKRYFAWQRLGMYIDILKALNPEVSDDILRSLPQLVPPGKRSVLEIGTAVHAGLATFHAGGIDIKHDFPTPPTDPEKQDEYDTLCEIASLSPQEQALHVAIQTLRKSLKKTVHTAFEDKSLPEAEEVVSRVLLAYIKHYSDTDEVWKPLNQEIEFLVAVGPDDSGAYLRGRTDNLSTAKGGLYIVDYKTAGRNDPRDLLKYELDDQLSSYIYGLTKYLTEQARKRDPNADPVFIRGAIIDVLVKTIVPQFLREMFTRSVDELREFEAEFIELCDELRERLRRVAAGEDWKTVFYKNTDNCFRYGTCPYRDVCLKDTPIRRRLYDKREPDYVDDAHTKLIEEFTRVA